MESHISFCDFHSLSVGDFPACGITATSKSIEETCAGNAAESLTMLRELGATNQLIHTIVNAVDKDLQDGNIFNDYKFGIESIEKEADSGGCCALMVYPTNFRTHRVVHSVIHSPESKPILRHLNHHMYGFNETSVRKYSPLLTSIGVNVLAYSMDGYWVLGRRSTQLTSTRNSLLHVTANEGVDFKDIVSDKVCLAGCAQRALIEEVGVPSSSIKSLLCDSLFWTLDLTQIGVLVIAEIDLPYNDVINFPAQDKKFEIAGFNALPIISNQEELDRELDLLSPFTFYSKALIGRANARISISRDPI